MKRLSPLQTLRLLQGYQYSRPVDPNRLRPRGVISYVIDVVFIAVVAAGALFVLNFPLYLARQAQDTIHAVQSHPDKFMGEIKMGGQMADLATRAYNAGRITAKPADKTALPLLKGQKFELEGPAVLVDWAGKALGRQGAVVVNAPCAQCVHMQWKGVVWHISSSLTEDKESELASSIKLALVAEVVRHEQATVRSKVTLAEPGRAIGAGLEHGLMVSIHLAAVVIAWLLVLSSGVVGYWWDRQRTLGHLEPWVCAVHPPWVLFGSHILSSMKGGSIFFGVMLALSVLWGLPLRWDFLLALWLCVPTGMMMVGLWSMLGTVLFHHSRGRMFSRLVLSPLTMGLVWSIRVFILWLVLQSTKPLKAYALSYQFLDKGGWLVGLACVFVAVSVILFMLIQLRIGRRREGLRKAL